MPWVGSSVRSLSSCSSTNDEAADWARAGAPHGAVVVAGSQHSGRGRLGRTWHSPPGESLYFSLVLRPQTEAVSAPALTLVAGVAVAAAVERFGVACQLKWPNDVLVSDKKLAGVLTEMSSSGGRIDHVVVGIGVNLSNESFPDDLAEVATSIRLERGSAVDRDEFLAVLCPSLESWLDQFFVSGLPPVARAWESRARLGPVVMETGLRGESLGLTARGGLRIRLGDGVEREILAGEVLLK